MENVAGLELPDSRWVDVDGPVHYRQWDGPDDGPTFVLVHGLGGSHVNWAMVAPGLSELGRVLALDLGGFGLTPPGGRGTSLIANRHLLHGFIERLDLGPVVLAGNSMGGAISLILAARAPRMVRGLVLVDAAFPRVSATAGRPTPRVAALFALYSSGRVGEWFMKERTRRLGPEGIVRETLRISAADPASIDPRLVAASVEMVRRRQGFDYTTQAFLDAARSIFKVQVAPARYRSIVDSVRAPALVVHGALDGLVPVAAAEHAAARHPNWDLCVYPDLGHIPMMEAPERWLDSVKEWIERRSAQLRPTG